MKIHEYQGKELFRKYGVPTPRGVLATTPEEAEKAATALGTQVVVVKAQIHAGGRGKGGGVKLAKSPDRGEGSSPAQILGMMLKTHQTGPEGQKVNKVYVEEGLPIEREFYLGMTLDRGDLATVAHGLQRGWGGDRGGGRQVIRRRSSSSPSTRSWAWRDYQGRESSPSGWGSRATASASSSAFCPRALPLLRRDRRLAGGGQSVGPAQGRLGGGARRQAELRRQRALPAQGAARLPRRRRGGPDRGPGQGVRPGLHLARRQHRLHGERRRPGHGHHGHHQAGGRQAGQLPRRGRWSEQGEGHRGVQAHPQLARR